MAACMRQKCDVHHECRCAHSFAWPALNAQKTKADKELASAFNVDQIRLPEKAALVVYEDVAEGYTIFQKARPDMLNLRRNTTTGAAGNHAVRGSHN